MRYKKMKYKINWHVLGAMLLSLVCWVIVILLLWVALSGCSTMKQSAEFTKDGVSIKLSNSKSSFMYWSKYKASVHNYGMSTVVYDAEGRPDPNSVKAFAEGVAGTILKGVRP